MTSKVMPKTSKRSK